MVFSGHQAFPPRFIVESDGMQSKNSPIDATKSFKLHFNSVYALRPQWTSLVSYNTPFHSTHQSERSPGHTQLFDLQSYIRFSLKGDQSEFPETAWDPVEKSCNQVLKSNTVLSLRLWSLHIIFCCKDLIFTLENNLNMLLLIWTASCREKPSFSLKGKK